MQLRLVFIVRQLDKYKKLCYNGRGSVAQQYTIIFYICQLSSHSFAFVTRRKAFFNIIP